MPAARSGETPQAEVGASCNLGHLKAVKDRTPGMQIESEPGETAATAWDDEDDLDAP